jgi:hypothetical protein
VDELLGAPPGVVESLHYHTVCTLGTVLVCTLRCSRCRQAIGDKSAVC